MFCVLVIFYFVINLEYFFVEIIIFWGEIFYDLDLDCIVEVEV